jgi:hypothetical protein
MKGPIVVVSASLLLSLTLLSGCKKDIQSKDAVREGVLKYLSKRGDLAAMDVSVAGVNFRGNEADATVHFQAKGNSAQGAGLTIPYVLERKGNEGVVKGRTGGDQHGAQGMPGGGGGGGSLPPGHPVVGSGSGGAAGGPGGSMPPLPTLPDHSGPKPGEKK